MATELVTCWRPDRRCGVCDALGVAYLIVHDERPTAHVCVDCIRSGSGPAALRARKRARLLAKAATDAALVGELVDEAADDWPVKEWD